MIASEFNQDPDNEPAIESLLQIIPSLLQAQTYNYTLAIGIAISLVVAL